MEYGKRRGMVRRGKWIYIGRKGGREGGEEKERMNRKIKTGHLLTGVRS